MKNKAFITFLSIIMFVVGAIAGIGGLAYITLPYNEELVVSAGQYYSKSAQDDTVAVAKGVQPAEEGAVSVHFLELGNKYTGDCTYIKVGENIDILIDCGSKSNSIATVSNYLNNYVTDGVLEYVIVTHAHQDHYAGFATTTKISSIFDLYECETIITFATTNQRTATEYINSDAVGGDTISTLGITSYASESKSVSAMYKNFTRELTSELNTTLTKGTKVGQKPVHYTATEVLSKYEEGKIVLDRNNDINLQILNNKFYTEKAASENNYSVCALVSQGDKHFIFTGDLESDGESELVKLNDLPQVELYKAGHHGSKTSSSITLLDEIQPKIVCVCCCAGSSEYTPHDYNQFPTKQFLINISQYTTNVYVTTLCEDYDSGKFKSFNGNIVVMAKKEDVQMAVYCSDNTTKLKDTEWFKNNRLQMCMDVEQGELGLHTSWQE